MKIVIAGSTGFIGSYLKNFLEHQGFITTGIGRDDFAKGTRHLADLISGHDVLINLTGSPVLKRWTKSNVLEIRESRLLTTQRLVAALSEAGERPDLFISASAIGIYSQNGIHNETSRELDQGFLGDLCTEWENQALMASSFINTYIVRLGIVLGNHGGALPKMVLPFRFGVGGKIGSGTQYISWIHIDDLCKALLFILKNKPAQRLFNLTAPNPATNACFTKSIASILSKPALFTVPPFALKLLYGQSASLLTGSQNVLPQNLIDAGFTFNFREIDQALIDLLLPAKHQENN